MKHKVIILSTDNQPQFLGGIKRVCSMLGDYWVEQHLAEALFMTFTTSALHKPQIGRLSQRFFPNYTDYTARENVDFLVDTANGEGATIVLNPHVEDVAVNALVRAARPRLKARTVGALHFSPTHTSDIIRQSFFSTYRLGYNPFRWSLDTVLWLKYHLYGAERIADTEETRHRSAIDVHDSFVLLSARFLSSFPQMYESKITAINNPSPASASVSGKCIGGG